jgi:hypothetical protein
LSAGDFASQNPPPPPAAAPPAPSPTNITLILGDAGPTLGDFNCFGGLDMGAIGYDGGGRYAQANDHPQFGGHNFGSSGDHNFGSPGGHSFHTIGHE